MEHYNQYTNSIKTMSLQQHHNVMWLLWLQGDVVIRPYFFGYKTEFFPFQNNPQNI